MTLDERIKQAVADAVAEEVEAAAKQVVERVRGRVGEIATRIAQYVDYQSVNDRLIITIRFKDEL